MLSKILSTAFRIGFVLVLIFSTLQIISQVSKSKIAYKTASREFIFARPGLNISCIRHSPTQKFSPDSIITFSGVNKVGDQVSAIVSTSNSPFNENGPTYIPVDDQLKAIQDNYYKDFSAADVEILNLRGEVNLLKPKVTRDIFGTVMQETEPTQLLRVLPQSTSHLMLFMLMNIIKFGSIALMLYFVGRLFSNFSKQEYFTASNIKMLMITGCLILVPQLSNLLFYVGYRKEFMATKDILVDGSYQTFANYSLTANIQAFEIMVGIGLITLSYIFKDALSIKTDRSFYI